MADATIRDVARRAEVSVASASRALNGLNNVRPDTRARVIAAADELGYVPHAGARSLSLSRSHAIGVVLPDLHGEFFSEIVRGMDVEASRRGYLLLLSNVHADDEQAATALRAMRGRVDGLLVMAPHLAKSMLERTLPAGLPAILINSPGTLDGRPSLRVDNAGGAEQMVRHLVERDHRRIVHIAGPEGNIDAAERAEGYRQALRAHAPEVEPIVIAGDFTEEAGEAAAGEILSLGPRCDGVFAANDMMAIGCTQALRAAGVEIPRQIAIGGFDDVPVARYLGVTTIHVSIAEMGGRAVQRLIAMLEGGDGGPAIELQPSQLVVRGTSVAIPAPAALRPS